MLRNPDPNIKSIVVGELTTTEAQAYDEVLYSGLGIGKSSTPSASAGSAKDLSRVSKELSNLPSSTSSEKPLPLDLSMPTTLDPKPVEHSLLPLDLTSTDTKATSELIDKPSTTKLLEEEAVQDSTLEPSPTPKQLASSSRMTKTCKEMRIQLNRLDLKAGQSVKVTQSMLDNLPKPRCSLRSITL